MYAGTVTGGEAKIYYSRDAYAEDGAWHLGYDKDLSSNNLIILLGFFPDYCVRKPRCSKHCEIRVAKSRKSETILLEDGYVLLVEKDVVMKKGTGGGKLIFD